MTFAEIADVLGLDERSVRRTWAAVIEKLRPLADEGEIEQVTLAIEMHFTVRVSNNSSTDNPTFSRVPRRFSANAGSGVDHAPRTGSPTRLSPDRSPGVDDRRVGHLPRRFRSKP